MAKRTVRVKTHRNHPEKLIELMRSVVKQHEELGASSPLNNASFIDMSDFKQKLTAVETLREEVIKARADAFSKWGQAKEKLGIHAGQTSLTEGTLFYTLLSIKKFLLIHHHEEPKNLGYFGFEVVIDTAKGIGRPRKKKQ